MPFVMSLACFGMNMTLEEALIGATLNAAAALDRADRVGSLEVGKQADVLLLDTADYRQLGYRFGANLIHTVIKRGRIVVKREA